MPKTAFEYSTMQEYSSIPGVKDYGMYIRNNLTGNIFCTQRQVTKWKPKMSDDWMIKFLEHKIKDPNFIRLVKRIFRTPIQENGKIETLTVGAVQWDKLHQYYPILLWVIPIYSTHVKNIYSRIPHKSTVGFLTKMPPAKTVNKVILILMILCKLFDIISNYKRIGERLCF